MESMPQTLSAILDHPDPSSPALIVPDDGQVHSFGQLAASVDELARCLAEAGVQRGDRVAFTLPNGPDVVQILLAIAALGAAAAPLNPAYTESEYAFYLTDIAPTLLLVPASRPAAAVAAARACHVEVLTTVAVVAEPPRLFVGDKQLTSVTGFAEGRPDDVGVVLHTSG